MQREGRQEASRVLRALKSCLKSRSQRRKAHKGVQMNVFEPALCAFAALREQKK
jgi:hypothetical protein